MSSATLIQPGLGSLARQLNITPGGGLAPVRRPAAGVGVDVQVHRQTFARPADEAAGEIDGAADYAVGLDAVAAALPEPITVAAPRLAAPAESAGDHAVEDDLIEAIEQLQEDARIALVHSVEQACTAASTAVPPDLVVFVCAQRPTPETLREWRADFDAVPLVVVCPDRSQEGILETLLAGASGYIPDTGDNGILLSALRLVLAGAPYIPPESVGCTRAAPVSQRKVAAPVAPPPQVRPRTQGLTGRQSDVLRCLVDGLSNKEIARQLGLGVGTVKCHLQAIYRALDVENRTRAVVVARNRLAEQED